MLEQLWYLYLIRLHSLSKTVVNEASYQPINTESTAQVVKPPKYDPIFS